MFICEAVQHAHIEIRCPEEQLTTDSRVSIRARRRVSRETRVAVFRIGLRRYYLCLQKGLFSGKLPHA